MANYTIEVWNKIDPIKGFDADYWKQSLKLQPTDGVFLVKNSIGIVERVEKDTVIKGNYNLDINLTTEQVGQEFLRMQAEEKLE